MVKRSWIVVVLLVCSFLSLNAQGAFIGPLASTRQTPLLSFNRNSGVTVEVNTSGVAYGHELLWTANTTGTNYEESAVVVYEGIAYLGSCSTHGDGHDTVFAVDIDTGEILWSAFTGPGYVGPVVDEDHVYYGTSSHGYFPDNEYLYAFNRSTGGQVWKLKVYGGIAESLQYDETQLYYASTPGVVSAVNKRNGSANWTINLGAGFNVVTKPLLKDDMLYIACYVSNGYGVLFKLAADDGHEIWRIDLPGGPWDNSLNADGNGRLFLAIYGSSSLYAYSEQNGSLLWEFPLHARPLSFNAYHDGVVFISDTDGYVYAVTSEAGSRIWETKIGGTCDISSPTLSNDLLFIGTRDGPDSAFFALDEYNGEILWRYPLGASVTAPPTVVNGMMLCGSDGWDMYAFDIGIGGGDWMLNRYDAWNNAYTSVGLTQWQYIQATCSQDQEIITCMVTNTYDHLVHNVMLRLPFSAYWYTESGQLLKENSETFTIDEMDSDASITLLITQGPLFRVTITKPENAVYFANTKVFCFFFPVVFAAIDIEATVRTNDTSSVDRVEFYLDDELQAIDTTPPYSVRWGHSFGFHHVKVVAYQNDASVSDELLVLKIL